MRGELDLALLRALYAGEAPAWARHAIAFVSFLGSGWMLVPLACVLASRALRLRVALLLGTLGATSALVSLLKWGVGRRRPFETIDWARALDVGVGPGQAWPSGHAAGSFAFAGFVLALDRRWGVAALSMAGAVAASRVALGVHWPTDVLAGAALGSLVGYAAGTRARGGQPASPTLPTQTPNPGGNAPLPP